jgi:hypothetical protein
VTNVRELIAKMRVVVKRASVNVLLDFQEIVVSLRTNALPDLWIVKTEALVKMGLVIVQKGSVVKSARMKICVSQTRLNAKMGVSAKTVSVIVHQTILEVVVSIIPTLTLALMLLVTIMNHV